MTENELFQQVASELELNFIQVKNTIEMLDDGNTVPFIARYRKEKTGSLDEDQIRMIEDRINYLRALEARKQTILHSINEQGKLTQELKQKIESTVKLQELEDLYLPYKPKKRTRATIARERGLQPLADMILKQDITTGRREEVAAKYVDPDKEISTVDEALQGARDILSEMISEDAEVRRRIREWTSEKGTITSEVKKAGEYSEYELYYDYSELVKRIPPHRILALNRGEKEGILKVNIEVDVAHMCQLIEDIYIKNTGCIFVQDLRDAAKDAYHRLIAPSITREVRSDLTSKADEHAINVFAMNLKNLLLQPPIREKVIMGIDPGYRTGCKVAVIDVTGKYLEGETIYPHAPQNHYMDAKSILRKLIQKYNVELIAIGNGTASRETEQLVAEIIRETGDERKVAYLITNESGASVYSASKIAKEEFPDLEASMRGNISIARRVLDPLAELVKIDPKSIGVGLYQHDVSQKNLAHALGQVVESCVNMVGINLNTASSSLLKYVSGLTSRTATNIVRYRDENGPFRTREDLHRVDGIGSVAFEQAAGFLRIPYGDNPLDNTSIHPESYEATQVLLKKFSIKDIRSEGKHLKQAISQTELDLDIFLNELGIGKPTFEDIILNIEKPGLDPRDEMPKPIFRSDVLKMEDLKIGMMLKGTVRNVVDFGAFIDIGVKQDGLIHISQMSKKFVKNPHEIVSVGDVVDVKVASIDLERGRIGLSLLITD